MKLDNEAEFEYSTVEWRFSGVTPTFFGLDPIIVFALPALLIGLAKQLSLPYFLALAAFIGICIYVSFFTSHRNLFDWIGAMRTKYLQRCQWGTE